MITLAQFVAICQQKYSKVEMEDRMSEHVQLVLIGVVALCFIFWLGSCRLDDD